MQKINTQHIANLQHIAKQLNTQAYMLLPNATLYVQNNKHSTLQQYANTYNSAHLITMQQLHNILAQHSINTLAQTLCAQLNITMQTQCIVFLHTTCSTQLVLSFSAYTQNTSTFTIIVRNSAIISAIYNAITQL